MAKNVFGFTLIFTYFRNFQKKKCKPRGQPHRSFELQSSFIAQTMRLGEKKILVYVSTFQTLQNFCRVPKTRKIKCKPRAASLFLLVTELICSSNDASQQETNNELGRDIPAHTNLLLHLINP